MVVIALLLLVVVVAVVVFVVVTGASGTVTLEWDQLNLFFEPSPLVLFLLGAATLLLAVVAIAMLRSGSRRSMAKRRELKRLRRLEGEHGTSPATPGTATGTRADGPPTTAGTRPRAPRPPRCTPASSRRAPGTTLRAAEASPPTRLPGRPVVDPTGRPRSADRSGPSAGPRRRSSPVDRGRAGPRGRPRRPQAAEQPRHRDLHLHHASAPSTSVHAVSRAPFAVATEAARSRTAPVHRPGAGHRPRRPGGGERGQVGRRRGDVPGGRRPPERGGRQRADGEDGDQGQHQHAARPVVAADLAGGAVPVTASPSPAAPAPPRRTR